MTRKDYLLLSEAMRDSRISQAVRDATAQQQYQHSVETLAERLAKDFHKFDKERFIKACYQ